MGGRTPHWSVKHTPSTATQATISKAAANGNRHVCTSLTAVISAGATAQTTIIFVRLRDGATGAGTIVWEMPITCPANDTRGISITDLHISGSSNTAMTLEFSAAGAAATQQSVSMTGYTTC